MLILACADGLMVFTQVRSIAHAHRANIGPLADNFQVVNACGMGFVAAEVSNGLGRHKYYLTERAYLKFLKYDYLDWAQVFATLALCKISICIFLLRLSSFRRLRLWLHGLIVVIITSHVPLFFLIVFQCKPVRKYWTSPMDGPGVCFTRATVETIIIVQGGELFNPLLFQLLCPRATQDQSAPSSLDTLRISWASCSLAEDRKAGLWPGDYCSNPAILDIRPRHHFRRPLSYLDTE